MTMFQSDGYLQPPQGNLPDSVKSSNSHTFHTDINGFCKHHCQLSAGNPISHKAGSHKHKNHSRPFTVPYFAVFLIYFIYFPSVTFSSSFSIDLFPLVQTVASGVGLTYNISVFVNKEGFRESRDSIETSVHHSGIRDQEWIRCLCFLLKYLSLFHCFLILLSTTATVSSVTPTTPTPLSFIS